jgi:hypothetical protein
LVGPGVARGVGNKGHTSIKKFPLRQKQARWRWAVGGWCVALNACIAFSFFNRRMSVFLRPQQL